MLSALVFISHTEIFLAAQNIFTENTNIKAALLFCRMKVDAFPERLVLAKKHPTPGEGCAEQTSQHSPTAARD